MSLFGMHPGAAPVGQQAAIGQPGPPAPFLWKNGRRMTPDQISLQQRLAQRQMAEGMDASPVGHWTQGLSRVAQALLGTMEMRRAERAQDANAAESRSVAEILASQQNEAGQRMSDDDMDAFLTSSAGNPYLDPVTRSLVGDERTRRMKAAEPQYFNSGNDRVMYDPRSGQSSVVYDGQSDAQDYAVSLGYEPGTPEFDTAVQDYVLRGNGPTAYGYDVDLENTRQGNREAMEGMRQRNRLTLRGTPTYSDLHPRSGGGGGRGSSPAAPTMAGTMAPILAKVSRGEPLTPGEQQAWSMYRSRANGGGRGKAGAPAAGGLPTPKTPDDFARLPKGAKFMAPDGTVRTK